MTRPVLRALPILVPALAPCQEGGDLAAARAALQKFGAKQREAKSLQCDYRQERTTVLLKRPLVSRGRLTMRMQPACLVFRSGRESGTVMRLTAEAYEVYRPRRKTLERTILGDRSLPDALFQAFRPDPEQLEKVFTIEKTAVVDGVREIHMKPRAKNPFLQVFVLAIDEKQNALRSVSYRDPQGDRIRLVVETMELDPKEAAAGLRFDVPEDTKVLTHRAADQRKKDESKG